MADKAQVHFDQLGNPWLVLHRAGSQWASGFDDDGMPVVKRIVADKIIVDWGWPNAERVLQPTGPTESEAERVADQLEATARKFAEDSRLRLANGYILKLIPPEGFIEWTAASLLRNQARTIESLRIAADVATQSALSAGSAAEKAEAATAVERERAEKNELIITSLRLALRDFDSVHARVEELTRTIEQKDKALAAYRENYQGAWSALRMVRQAIEELGPVGVLPSEEAVTATLGPEPIHEATALVEGIRKIAARAKGMEFPSALSPDLAEILGRPNFACARIAEAFRLAGEAEIAHKAEAEQAFVLHWLTTIFITHGADWRNAAADKIDELNKKNRERFSRPEGGAS